MQSYDAFVSYSRRDEALVKPVVKLLAVGGRKIFWDAEIEPGERWENEIDDAIANSTRFIVLWCCHSAESDYVDGEIRAADALHKPIIPVMLCTYPMRPPVRAYQGIDMRMMGGHSCNRHIEDTVQYAQPPRYRSRTRSPGSAVIGLLLLLLALWAPFPSELDTNAARAVNFAVGAIGLLIALGGLERGLLLLRANSRSRALADAVESAIRMNPR